MSSFNAIQHIPNQKSSFIEEWPMVLKPLHIRDTPKIYKGLSPISECGLSASNMVDRHQTVINTPDIWAIHQKR